MTTIPGGFVPLDPDTLPHFTGDRAVNRPVPASTLDLALRLARVSRAIGDAAREDDEAVDAAMARYERALPVEAVPVSAGGVTVIHRGRIPAHRARHLAWALGMVGAVAVLLGFAAPAPQAQAATGPAKGPGLTLRVDGRTEFVGPYVIGGHLLYCTDEGYQLGDGAVRKGTGPAKADGETRARLAALVNAYGQVGTPRDGARVKLAVATLIAPFDQRMRAHLPGLLAQMTAADRTEITAMVAASAVHGPFNVAVSAPVVAPGRTATATVTVRASSGQPAAGVPVVVAGRTVKTGAGGTVAVQAPVTTLSQVISATVTAPSSTAVWQNTPSRGHQLMIGGGFTEGASGSTCITSCPVSARVSLALECDDAGRHALTVAFRAEAIPGTYRGVLSIGGTVSRVEIAPGEMREVLAQVADGQAVTVGWEILAADGSVAAARTLWSTR